MAHHPPCPAGTNSGRTNPLDEIRMAEARAASLAQQAGLAAEALLAAARTESERCRQAARAAGQQVGQVTRQQQMRAAAEEAARIQREAQAAVQALKQQGQPHLSQAAAWALAVVMGEIHPGPAGQPEVPKPLHTAAIDQ